MRGTPTLFVSGVASWAPGQLAGEVRNGSWGWVGGRYVERDWFGQTFSGRRLAGIYESEPRLAFLCGAALWPVIGPSAAGVAESPFVEVCLRGVN